MNHHGKRMKFKSRELHIENKVNKLRKQVVLIIWIKITEAQEEREVVKWKNLIMRRTKKN